VLATIVYYSVSGRNEQVARAVERELNTRGATTKLRLLQPRKSMGVIRGALMSVFGRPVELEDATMVGNDDLLVVVGPVWASSINPPMRAFLETLPDLARRRVINLVCGFNPHPEVVKSINKLLEHHHAGPIVSRAIRLRDIDDPDKTAELVAQVVTEALG
jgi:multimeric flavodoxin WrbA